MDLDTYLKEPLEFEADVDPYLNPGDKLTIFEIGSCEGEDTIKLRRKYPNADIYAFEPLPKNIRKIKDNYKKYKADGIKLFQLALSDKDGHAGFHVSSGQPKHLPKSKGWDYGNKSSSLLPPKEHMKLHEWIKFNRKIKVETKRLDSFCEKHAISDIDLVYLDVQGAEKLVLEGAGEWLKRIKMIWMEVEAIELYRGQPLKEEVEIFMSKNGFDLIKDTVNDVSGDQLYINRRFKNSRGGGQIRRNLRSWLTKKNGGLIYSRNGMDLVIPRDMAWAIQDGRYYERNVEYWIGRIANGLERPVFYDVGANYGIYSLTLSGVCEKCIAFEPVKSTFRVLRSNIRHNKSRNVKAYNIALGQKKRVGKIFIYSSSGNNSPYSRNLPEGHPTKFVRTENIQFETLDNFIKSTGEPEPAMIKVDTEGGELSFLKGATNTIRKSMPVIIMEYSTATSEDAGYDRTELLSSLRNFGYIVHGLSSDTHDNTLYSPKVKRPDIDNLIAVPKSLDIKKW